MKRPELYKKTVDILYNAYFNDTLEHGNYCGCAVGNMIAANMGVMLTKGHRGNRVLWNGSLEEGQYWHNLIAWNYSTPEALNQINSTGYTVEEITKIERAFEYARDYNVPREDNMFNGLVAVLKVLDEIHEVEQDTAAQSKERFATHYATLQS